MKRELIVAIDIGTTSTKTLAYDQEGRIYAEVEKEYPLYSPEADRKEQDPDEIYEAVIYTLTEVSRTVKQKR